MDDLDFAIYRYLSPDGEARFWASRRMVDPRVPVHSIARHVGISEAGVRVRIKSLRERGFLRGSEVWPNPSLFGVATAVAEMPVTAPGDVDRIVRELSLVEGVTFVRDVLDEEDRKLFIFYVSDTTTATARRTALLRRLAPDGRLRGPSNFWIPPCARALSNLDWKILRVLREFPDGGMRANAGRAGVSLKTFARRYNQLLDARACWYTPSRDTLEMPLALLTVSCREAAEVPLVGSRVTKTVPRWIPVAADGLGQPPEAEPKTVSGLVVIDTPASLEAQIRKVLALPNVAGVRRTFALGSSSYPEWFDEHIAARASSRGVQPPVQES